VKAAANWRCAQLHSLFAPKTHVHVSDFAVLTACLPVRAACRLCRLTMQYQLSQALTGLGLAGGCWRASCSPSLEQRQCTQIWVTSMHVLSW
jgi:hypothetical protein